MSQHDYLYIQPKRIGLSSVRLGGHYTVASVELGNTTTKCIIVTTNLKTGEMAELAKEVRMTRDVRPPVEEEETFGRTLIGIPLTRASVAEMVASILNAVMTRLQMRIETDLHFVVRSTGVTAGFSSPEEVDHMVRALADGCLLAGIPPRLMTAALSTEGIPESVRAYSWLDRVRFDGAIASCMPPSRPHIVANEMEGELVTAGIKGAARSKGIDFRNPVMTLDFGTTLAGRITDDSHPYAKTIGSFAGIAGAIPDAIARGSGAVDPQRGCALDLNTSRTRHSVRVEEEWVEMAHRLICVKRIRGGSHFGSVPVDPGAADEAGVCLFGVDVGENCSRMDELERLGHLIAESAGIEYVSPAIDHIQARLVQRLVELAENEGLISRETALGFTGRAITTGGKPQMVAKSLRRIEGSLWSDIRPLIFVDDGLAMGAAMAARCMNSMGIREHPVGGRRGDSCIMGARIRLQRERCEQNIDSHHRKDGTERDLPTGS